MLWIITLSATGILYWIYDGYGRCLQWLCLLQQQKTQTSRLRPTDSSTQEIASTSEPESWPSVTVLLTVHNEAPVICRRIENLLALDYPTDRLRILVASDGSTDDTNQLVREFDSARVQLFESPGLGKTGTQNAALRQIDSEIIVFTDADILFEPSWLRNVAAQFDDPEVGAVDGRAEYRNRASDAVQASQGFYWNYELKLRTLESQLGILAVVAGACFAVRRNLIVPMDPAIGEDCIVPLDVVSQGRRVVHQTSAVAWFGSEEDSAVTLRRRVRMTLRNWQGTWTRGHLLNPWKHPGYAFALWSHKLLRWLSPLFLAAATISSFLQAMLSGDPMAWLMFAPFGLLFLLAGAGAVAMRKKRQIPGTGTAYSFVLANAAFLIGLWRAVTGHQIHSYRNA